MTTPKICAALFAAGMLALVAAVLFGPSVPGTYCIYAGITSLGLGAGLMLLYVIISLYQEFAAL
jgi:hypothetical protein